MSTLPKIMLFCVVALATTICMPVQGASDKTMSHLEIEMGFILLDRNFRDIDVQIDDSRNIVIYATQVDPSSSVRAQTESKEERDSNEHTFIDHAMMLYEEYCQDWDVQNIEIYITNGRYYTCSRARVDTAVKDGKRLDLIKDVIAEGT